MCGIVGYIGSHPAADFLLKGLHRLEYRGYDSAGLAVIEPSGAIAIRKSTGRVEALANHIAQSPLTGKVGIGHTRWATHGEVTDANAHPHSGGNGQVVLVHNGVIENHILLREFLQQRGYAFATSTDTETVAHLIAYHLAQFEEAGRDASDPLTCQEAVEIALSELKGTYGLAILFAAQPQMIIAARLGSPLVIGIGSNEYWLASDVQPLAGHTNQVVYLADQELAVLTSQELALHHRVTGTFSPSVITVTHPPEQIEQTAFQHHMLKEIYEQPLAVENALRGRFNEPEATAHFGGLNLTNRELRRINRIVLTACGTSWHAGLVGEYLIEELARLPVEVEYASELRYRNSPLPEGTMVFAITQSGETADTLAAMKECQRKGLPALAICNVVGSSIAREADGGVYLHAGPELGVASTKAFTSQVAVLTLLALYFGRLRHLSYDAGQRLIAGLKEIPEAITRALACNDKVVEIAERYANVANALFLGRLYNFPVALEGALKLKEVSYIHAEGYPAAEMKHGPIALIDKHTPSIFVVPRCGVYPKVLSNMEEVKARKGPVIAVACEGDTQVAKLADEVIYVPEVAEYLQPLVTVIPLQLLAYHIAVKRGCNVDRPRNLAKSVTVE